jgi:hypothetical protein
VLIYGMHFHIPHQTYKGAKMKAQKQVILQPALRQ